MDIEEIDRKIEGLKKDLRILELEKEILKLKMAIPNTTTSTYWKIVGSGDSGGGWDP